MTNTDTNPLGTDAEQLPEWWTTPELAAFFSISTRTLERWRAEAAGPDWELDGRRVRYHRDAIAQYLADHTVTAIGDDEPERPTR